MSKQKSRLNIIITDVAGITCIIVAPLIGWLPGPGGIPLFLAGLSLLASNHAWAQRLQKRLHNQTKQTIKTIFQEHPLLQAFYDLLTTIFMVGGIYLIYTYTRNLTLTFAIFLLITAVVLFLGNRRRLEKFLRFIKR